jgi:ankyrin repeat protein
MAARRRRRTGRLRTLLGIGLLLCLPLLHGGGGSGGGGARRKRRRKRPPPPPSPAAAAPSNSEAAEGEGVQVMITGADGSERDLDDDLRLACNLADLERVSELLEWRREIEAVEGFGRHPRDADGNSPLHDAARRGLVEVAELLLDEGEYDVDIANGMGDRPLHMSAASGHLGMTKVLVEHGAQVDALTSWGMTALWWSASEGSGQQHVQVAQFLLKKGADVNAMTTMNQTALVEAARQGNAGMAQLLLDAGAESDATDGLGETALHKAAAAGHVDVIRAVLSAGANANATNLAGETLLDVARRAQQASVVKFLTGGSVHSGSGPGTDATVIASAAAAADTREIPVGCPHGTRNPSVPCGNLDPRAYIAELQHGPGAVYSSMRQHPELFDAQASEAGWPLEWFSPGVRAALQVEDRGARTAALASLLEPESDDVYSFDLFDPGFAAMFVEEIENYQASGLPVRRVNSMNRYGIIVNEIGMHHMIRCVRAGQQLASSWPAAGSLACWRILRVSDEATHSYV